MTVTFLKQYVKEKDGDGKRNVNSTGNHKK